LVRLTNIVRSNLFRITSLNSLSVLVKIVGGLLSSMVTAKLLGPAGMALTGNLRSFLLALDTYSTLGFQNGIIKYTAEHQKNEEKLHNILSTVFYSVAGGILFMSLMLFFLADYWNKWVFSGMGNHIWVFRMLALALPWYAGNLIFLSVLNGLGKYRQVIVFTTWSNIAGVIVSVLLIWKWELDGAFLGLAAYPALLFLFSFYMVQQRFPRLTFLKKGYFDYQVLKGLLSYSLMSFITAILSPVVFLAIRNYLIIHYNLSEAGYWEGIMRISSFYFLFISTLLTVYFLPKLSMAQTAGETKAVFREYFKFVIPLFAAGLLIVYFLRYFIIRVLLSAEFLPMESLFIWQLAGDFFKACSFILGYQLIAKKMTRVFITSEILSFIVLYTSSMWLIERFGTEGAVMAHALTYLLYLVILSVYFQLFFKRTSP